MKIHLNRAIRWCFFFLYGFLQLNILEAYGHTEIPKPKKALETKYNVKSEVDELINRKIKNLLKNVSSDSAEREELLFETKTLLEYKSRLEISEILEKKENQFDGFYVGGGISSGQIGQSLNSKSVQQSFNFEHKMLIGDPFIVRLRNIHGGGGPIGPDDVADTVSEISNMVSSGSGRVRSVHLVREDGAPANENDFFKVIGAPANSATSSEIRNINYLIKAELETKSESVSIDERKNQVAGVVVIGCGKVFPNNFYTGLELMNDVGKNVSLEKQKMQIKTAGFSPILALRAGLLHDEWLAYGKIGVVYSRVFANDDQRFGKFIPLIGGGIEKAFGNNFSLRIDADYVCESTYNLWKTDSYSLTYKKGTIDETGTGAGSVGLLNHDFTYTTAEKRNINLKIKGVFNVRLIFSYHMRTI